MERPLAIGDGAIRYCLRDRKVKKLMLGGVKGPTMRSLAVANAVMMSLRANRAGTAFAI